MTALSISDNLSLLDDGKIFEKRQNLDISGWIDYSWVSRKSKGSLDVNKASLNSRSEHCH